MERGDFSHVEEGALGGFEPLERESIEEILAIGRQRK